MTNDARNSRNGAESASPRVDLNRLKILVVCQYYWPEPFPLEDICEELVKRGHEVDVITGVPNYPMGYIYDEYKNGKNRNQVHNGVNIHRCFTVARRKNHVFRLLNYLSFAASSTLHVLASKEKYDVVFGVQTSPILMSYAALAYAKKHKIKSILYSVDLWPASLSVGGVRSTSLLYRLFGIASKHIYRNADEILISSQSFRTYLRDEFQIADERIIYHPQYAIDQFRGIPPKTSRGETFEFVFAGNIGAAQSLNTIIEAADILRNEAEIRFHIVGDGSELGNLRKHAEKLALENVIFHGRKPLADMPQYYAMADAMLVTLTEDPFISMTLPGKVQTYMAAGKPIIAAADGEIALTLKEAECGFCVNAGDAAGLADAIRRFVRLDNTAQMGANARAYYEMMFSRERFMDVLEDRLKNASC